MRALLIETVSLRPVAEGTDPALQALDFVLRDGALTDEERADVQTRFPITTLERLIRTPAVRALIGIDIAGEKLMTDLPATEVISLACVALNS